MTCRIDGRPAGILSVADPVKPESKEAAEVDLSGAELNALDALTAPAPLYPHWFHNNLVDATHKETLS